MIEYVFSKNQFMSQWRLSHYVK